MRSWNGNWSWVLALLVVVSMGCSSCTGGDDTPTPPSGGGGAEPGTGGDGASAGALGTATIKGKISFEGKAPANPVLNMGADPVCAELHKGAQVRAQKAVINDGAVQYAIVYVKEGTKGKYAAPTTTVVLDQHGCTYVPHVFTVQVKQPVQVKSSDDTLHNVHALVKKNPDLNQAMPNSGVKPLDYKFLKSEMPVRIKCDVHGWMECYAGVFDHPFHTVTAADGTFSIGQLPAGDYTIEVWHETLGTRTQAIKVGDGEAKELNFTLGGQQ